MLPTSTAPSGVGGYASDDHDLLTEALSLRFKHEEFCDGLYIRRKTLSLGDPCVQALFFMAG